MKSTLFLIAVFISLAACNKEVAPPAKTIRPALTQIVGKLAIAGSNQYSGEIRARHEPVLSFRVSGKIIERRVAAGERVKAGQVLVRLDPADAGLQAGAAQAQYRLAKADAQRYRELHSKGFVSSAALGAKEAALQTASAEAALARNQKDYTALRAEHDGVVETILADVGQVVSSGQPVLRLAESGETEAAIDIPEDQFALRHVGDAAQIDVSASNGPPLKGHLREMSASADPASRTYAARVAFDAQGGVALGMSVRVRFEPGASDKAALLIPLSAIYQQGRQTAVWVVADNHSINLRQVTVAAYRDDGAVIVSGLKTGERIVSAGAHRLSEGEVIRPVDNGSAQ